MFESLKNLYSGNLEECKNNMLFPILRWTTGNKDNIPTSNLANKYFFFVKPEVIKSILYYGLPKKYVTKYPKKIKTENSFIYDKYIKQYFGYNYKEMNLLIPVLEEKLKDKQFKIKIATFFGLDKKECKQLGLDYKELTKDQLSSKKPKSLFDF